MVDPAGAKQALRSRLRSARRALPPEQRAAETAATVATCLRLTGRIAPPALASYAALPDELDLSALHRAWWDAGRVLLLPRVAGAGVLAWHRVAGEDALRPGAFGIREPDPGLAPETGLPAGVLVIVPGTGFARDGSRLGQGGGFYDRIDPAALTVGVGFGCQLCDRIPTEAHDRVLAGLIIAGELIKDP